MKKILLLLVFTLLICGCEIKVDPYTDKYDTNVGIKDVEYSVIASTYINTVRKKVNNGSIAVFDENSMYLVPVGNANTFGCSGTEEYTSYGSIHQYAYVGIIKKKNTTNYFYVSRDSLGNGYNFSNENTINSKGKGIRNGNDLLNYTELSKLYNVKGSSKDKYTELELDKVDVNGSMKETIGYYLSVDKVKIYTYRVCE